LSTPQLHLDVTTDQDARVVRLNLRDDDGRHLDAHAVRLGDYPPALWEGLFDTRAHVNRYAGGTRFTDRPATADDLMTRLGVFLGRDVLGAAITARLHEGIGRRDLVIRLPPTEDDPLAAAFARVPWEIARPDADAPALMGRNLAVRTVLADASDALPEPPAADEPIRVLLVFAEAPGSRPLAMRLEREQLLALFHDRILQERQVDVHFLCHGVTRDALAELVSEHGGYHVIHWSGHGGHDVLELYGDGGRPDYLTGEGLVELLDEAGGFVPRLVFLSACLSGTLLHVRDRAALEAALAADAGTRRAEPEAIAEAVKEESGYTSTALALRRAGVPHVVAMRYEVGDAYARDLASRFYRRLLADAAPKSADQALAMARRELLDHPSPDHGAVDHATPMLLGSERLILRPPKGRSAALQRWRPRPQPLVPGSRELDASANFVGRGDELTRLRLEWLLGKRPAVAVVQGLAGMGKTALAAEAVHLWHRRFDGVYAFQSKPVKLTVDEFLRTLDQRLTLNSQAYREFCNEQPGSRVFLPVDERLTGEERYRQLRDNLLEVLRRERLLLVLDNFETQLESVATDGGYACADREWDRLLEQLADGLPETGSRLLVTSRHQLATLASAERALGVALGPLPAAEAFIYLQGIEELRRLLYGGDESRKLALRLLEVSRGHPLIMSRLGTLAGVPEALAKALDELEAKGLGNLPDLFTGRLSAEELAYLEDAAVRSVDLLLERASADARRLLWVVTLASEPVTEELIVHAWSESSSVGPLLAELTASGLLASDGVAYAFHELVRERVDAWMAAHPEERGGYTETQVWEAYGERYAAGFLALMMAGGEGTRERAVAAGRRGLSYFVRARAFGRLGSFAGDLVISTRDPALLRGVIAELEGVADQVPAGEDRWSLRTYLADAFRRAGRSDAALRLYEQAAAEAEEAGLWADVGWIRANWANALRDVGQLDAAKATQLRSAEAEQKAGSPRVQVVGSELEALRIDVMQGAAERAWPEIASRLDEVRAWWRRTRGGEPVPEAPDPVFLGRVLVGALDIAEDANRALERWQACLDLLAEIEETKRTSGEGQHERARTRINRYGPLLSLRRLDDAQRVLEGCLDVFREADDVTNQSKALSALADLWDERGDRVQAVALERHALAVRDRLPDLADRSISHGNLSNYLDRSGETEEAARHLLAAIVYDLVMNHRQGLNVNLSNLGNRMRRAAPDPYELPRLADLLSRPEFEALKRVLEASGFDAEGLQGTIDGIVEDVRQQVASTGGKGKPEET